MYDSHTPLTAYTFVHDTEQPEKRKLLSARARLPRLPRLLCCIRTSDDDRNRL